MVGLKGIKMLEPFISEKEYRCFLLECVQLLRKEFGGSLAEIRGRSVMRETPPTPPASKKRSKRAPAPRIAVTLKLVAVTAGGRPTADSTAETAYPHTTRLQELAVVGAESLFRETSPPDVMIKRGGEIVRATHIINMREILSGIKLEVKVTSLGTPMPPSLDLVWRVGFLPLSRIDITPFTHAEAPFVLAEAGVQLVPEERVERVWVEKNPFAPRGADPWRWAVSLECGEWPDIHEPRRRVVYLAHGNSWHLAGKRTEVPTGSRTSRHPHLPPAAEPRRNRRDVPTIEEKYCSGKKFAEIAL